MASYQAILTFDDGPLDEQSAAAGLNRILEILNKERITGVFYLTGREVQQKPFLAMTIFKKGHIVQNHSWQHKRLDRMSEKELREDLSRTQQTIKGATGVLPDRLRPPYGAGRVGGRSELLEKVAQSLRLTVTGWDVDTNDWMNPAGLNPNRFAPPRSRWKEMGSAQQRPLDILMHVNQTTARDLQGFIDWLRKDGCGFTTYKNPSSQKLLVR